MTAGTPNPEGTLQPVLTLDQRRPPRASCFSLKHFCPFPAAPDAPGSSICIESLLKPKLFQVLDTCYENMIKRFPFNAFDIILFYTDFEFIVGITAS
jgi:hypothetical protein